ncbi:MAG: rhomboid family intramembrane serine protease [Candidatus Amoebophilus sp.]
MKNLTPVVEKILIINVIIFVASKFLGLNLVSLLGLRYVFSPQFSPYQILTHLFTHASFYHLFSNMFTLVTFGPVLEYYLSSKRFIYLYIVTGIGAALLYMLVFYLEIGKIESMYYNYLVTPTPKTFTNLLYKFPHIYNVYHNFVNDFFNNADDPAYIARSKAIVAQLEPILRHKVNIPIVGASGATFGLLTAFAMLFPNARLSLLLLPIPIKAKYFVILYGMYELYTGIQAHPADNVAHFAHLGGILFAYLFIKWYQKNTSYR